MEKCISGVLRSDNEIYVFLSSIKQKKTNFAKHFAFVEMNKANKTSVLALYRFLSKMI